MVEKEEQTGQAQAEQPEEMTMDMNSDENIAGTNHLNEDISDESAVDRLQAELQEQKDKYLRLYAEFDNYKRRTSREKVEQMQTAGKEVIQSLLEVLDDTDRAEKQINNTDDANLVKQGVQLVFQKLRSVMQARGLKEMQCIGTEFNPDIHEAITEIPSPGHEGKVVDEVEKGYYLNNKIIRFAKVVVGK
jgi:molecular chaperone GrpE